MNFNKSIILPNCPSCYVSDYVTMVDTTVTTNYYNDKEVSLSTLPVWHCNQCGRLFGDRTVNMGNTISCNVPQTILTNSNYISQAIDATAQQERNLEIRILELENQASYVINAVQELQETVKQQKDDLLHSLRNEVSNFSLS
jgi:hypothetical protein